MREETGSLYRVFASYSSRVTEEGLPSGFHSKNLETLVWEDFGKYPASAILTMGDVDDFKHFLPRLLELRTDERPDWPDIEILFGKFRLADLAHWPEVEKEAVHRFLSTLWSLALSKFPMEVPSQTGISELVCAMAAAGSEFPGLLDYWDRQKDDASSLHLVEFVEENFNDLMKKKSLANAFWETEWAEHQQLLEWLASGKPKAKLETSFFQAEDETLRIRLSGGSEMLDAFERNWG